MIPQRPTKPEETVAQLGATGKRPRLASNPKMEMPCVEVISGPVSRSQERTIGENAKTG
jgi:hypothetical protein